jgi:hypothetical protein
MAEDVLAGSKEKPSMTSWISNLLKNVPELQKIYNTVYDPKKKEFIYSEDAIVNLITSSNWYLTNGPKVAANIAARYKFGEKYYNQQISQYKITISAIARTLGLDIADAKVASYLSGLAETSYLNGWDDAYIENTIVSNGDMIGSIAGGAYATQVQNLAEYANLMGVSLSETDRKNYQARLVGTVGPNGLRQASNLDALKKEVVDQQSLLYPMFSDDFAAGRTLWDVTALHRKKWADLLEVSPDSLDWNDPLWKDGKIFTMVDEKSGKVLARPVWDAEKLIKKDERWQYTENADRTYEAYGLGILNKFGFAKV